MGLFKEYCIADVSRYKENKIGLRWRTQPEVVSGKGQFVCGAKKCEEKKHLRTWEVNFGYIEHGQKRNALIKVRLCFECSYKLNYHHKKKRRRSSSSSDDEREKLVKKAKEERKKKEEEAVREAAEEKEASNIWGAPVEKEVEKDREEVFSEFLEDLFM